MQRYALLLCLLAAGCVHRDPVLDPRSVVAPTPYVVAAAPSFDGNRADSGIRSAGPHGFVVSAGYVASYRDLLTRYGDKLAVRPAPDRGLKQIDPDSYEADAQVIVDRGHLLRVARAAQQ